MNMDQSAVSPQFRAAKLRKAPLTRRVKFYQAIGALPDTYKNFAFNTFLLIFYNQVLGVPAALASAALMIAVIVDAVTDPLVGSYSDSLVSRFGRRHGLMYTSVLPLAITLYLLFSPPAGLGEQGLFLWLLAFSIASRLAMTLFLVPWSALFAEFSDDYEERSAIITYRYLVGALGGVIFIFSVWTFIFHATDKQPNGQLNAAAYEVFAPVLAIAVAIAAYLTTRLTLSELPYLRQPVNSRRFTMVQLWRDLVLALRNRDFLVLFLGLLIASVLTGIIAAFEIYFHTYFWGFNPSQIRWLALGISGAVIGAALVPWLQKRYDKKDILLVTMLISLADGVTIIGLKLAGFLPPASDPVLLPLLVVNEVLRLGVVTITVIMFTSMVADTLDAQELNTGLRQEGVFSAAVAFSAKAVSGVGVFATGLLLEFVIGFPQQAAPGEVSEDAVFRLGFVGGIVVPLLYLFPFYLATLYRISRNRHAEIRAQLAEKIR